MGNGHDYLSYLLVFLVAAVVAVPLFRRLGLGAVLGYLAAGVVLGPDVIGFIRDPETALTISEFGVVLLLFIIGLELSPARLWVMRKPVFGAGGLQVGLSALALGIPLLLLLGLGWKTALVVALGLALSSTAVGLQILAERRELTSAHGRTGFAILLFQDLVAIPLLAAIPLLGIYAAALESEEAVLGALLRAGVAVVAVVLLGRFVVRYLFRAVAHARAVEVFTAATLLVVAGNAWLMQQAGLSMGLGAFLAGVLLADSEFRHELESHIEPFKGLLLGLFFMAIGMTVDLDLLVQRPVAIAVGVIALVLAKAVVLVVVGVRVARLSLRDALVLASLLGMGGEFAFVVFAEAFRAGLLDPALRDLLVAVVGLSMALTPLGLLLVHRLVPEPPPPEPGFEPIEETAPRVIIAGFGRVGQIVARLLRAQHIPFIALENSPEQVESSRRFGTKIYYGDPARADLLRAAHADRAEVFVLATDDPEANIRTARMVRRMYPHLKVFARARNRQHAFRLMDLGVDAVVRETFHSSLVLGRHVLKGLALPPDLVEDRTERFRQHDEKLLREQHLVYDDEARLIVTSQEALRDLERIFEADVFPHAGAVVPGDEEQKT